jgi:hypothetical protein
MKLQIMDKVTLESGREVTVVGFEKIDGETLAKVMWTNVLGETHWIWVSPEKVRVNRVGLMSDGFDELSDADYIPGQDDGEGPVTSN